MKRANIYRITHEISRFYESIGIIHPHDHCNLNDYATMMAHKLERAGLLEIGLAGSRLQRLARTVSLIADDLHCLLIMRRGS